MSWTEAAGGRLPRWLRPDHPLVRPVLAAPTRQLRTIELALLAALAAVWARTARYAPNLHPTLQLFALGLLRPHTFRLTLTNSRLH